MPYGCGFYRYGAVCNSQHRQRYRRRFSKKAYEKVCEKLNSFKIETKLQESRSIIQEQVYKSVESNANVYTLNMPTGSGKLFAV